MTGHGSASGLPRLSHPDAKLPAMDDTVIFSPPPARPQAGGAPGKYVPFFDALRSRPGEWAEWQSACRSPSAATNIKNGVYSGTSPGEFDATVRKQPDGTWKMWVRYGEEDER